MSNWGMHKVALAPGEVLIRWGNEHVATVRKEVAMAIFRFLGEKFPDGPPQDSEMDAIEGQIAEQTGVRGPREMIAIEDALKKRGEKP